MKRISLILLALAGAAMAADDLDKNFITPPAEARPWVYWFTLSGNMTKESITADLESMARVGIGGVIRFEVGQPGTPVGPVAYNGKEWHELFQHACKEAARLGLEINMANSPSWAGSGGPWITPEHGMQNVAWTETVAEGGRKLELLLPQPKAVMDYYRDVAVLAMPAPEGEGMTIADYGAKLTSSGTKVKPGLMKLNKPAGTSPAFIQIEFPQPFKACWFKAMPSIRFIRGELKFSDDGKTYKPARNCLVVKNTPELAFKPITARFFRFEITEFGDGKDSVEISDLNLGSSFRIENFYGKAFFTSQTFPPQSAIFPPIPAAMTIPRDQVRDITTNMDAAGNLSWDAPSGRWLILRLGATLKGQVNFPAPAGGQGLECDKMSVEAATAAFNGQLEKLIAENKALSGPGKTWVATHIDSWESNGHNWTPKLREEFKKRRGYDLWSYLPILTGRVVDNLETSERFLWDLRQTYCDLVVDNYAGTFRRLANEHGLRLTVEPYGAGCPTDNLAYGGQADEPMAEFWSWHKYLEAYSCPVASSAAHLYGKKIVGAEAFTARRDERWLGHPGNIKDLGDWAFCEGINRFAFHRFAAQRFPNIAPGFGMGFWGLHYERTQTWWEQSKPWHEYLARCQHLLRQGLFVADVLYLQPEGAPRRFEPPADAYAAPHIRGGYNFDGCNNDVLLNRLSFKGGKFVLPDGMSYRVLVVPPAQTMTPRVLRKLKEFADQGAMLIADAKPPVKSPSLADMGEGDEAAKKIAAELWPKLVVGKTAAQLLGERGVKPDFSARPVLRYIHRATAGTDLYFVANPEPTGVDAVAEFRIAGKQPELWWPDTGRTEVAKDFEIQDGITRVPLRLDAIGSVFVIFRQATTATKGAGKNWVETTPVQEITGPWEVSYDPKWVVAAGRDPAKPVIFDKLQDWSKRPEEGIKYYSGHAIYRNVFHIKHGGCLSGLSSTNHDCVVGRASPATAGEPVLPSPHGSTQDTSSPSSRGRYAGEACPTGIAALPKFKAFLDLGKVAIMAEVTLNGKPLGVLWKQPYRVDVSDAIKDGENTLEIKVVNLWINRMIGDEQLPEDSKRNAAGELIAWPQWLLDGKPNPSGRYTFVGTRLWKKDDPLVESGLLGPVKLECVKELR